MIKTIKLLKFYGLKSETTIKEKHVLIALKIYLKKTTDKLNYMGNVLNIWLADNRFNQILY